MLKVLNGQVQRYVVGERRYGRSLTKVDGFVKSLPNVMPVPDRCPG
jgi:hypothetical protein